jgi:DNA-binding transcriptional MerR regulator
MSQTANVYLIKDLSRLSGQSIHTIKFYLKLGLLKEAGRSPETRFRYFDDSTIETLAGIRALQKEGKSLAEIAGLMRSGPPAEYA